MSDYIFNCFKEHVKTGLVCSLSAGATDVLTEWRGQPPLCHWVCFSLHRSSHINILYSGTCTHLHWKWLINIKVHFHFKTQKNDRRLFEPITDLMAKTSYCPTPPNNPHSPAISSTRTVYMHQHSQCKHLSSLWKQEELKFTLSNRSLLHTCCIYVNPSNRVQECTTTDIDPKPHLCFNGDNKAPDIQHFSQTIIIYCQINIYCLHPYTVISAKSFQAVSGVSQ